MSRSFDPTEEPYESRLTYGSVRGAAGNSRPYRDLQNLQRTLPSDEPFFLYLALPLVIGVAAILFVFAVVTTLISLFVALTRRLPPRRARPVGARIDVGGVPFFWFLLPVLVIIAKSISR
ncbi:hypothetical protein [Allorhodopirellula solitaria]|uniref:hypothetical protein n=1 Tax=Allorhodopirellula solitaria TaxID=2527987 RepID=UPI0011B7DD57|nr:hypothetical protein [Allorhodopirellula solitaria]